MTILLLVSDKKYVFSSRSALSRKSWNTSWPRRGQCVDSIMATLQAWLLVAEAALVQGVHSPGQTVGGLSAAMALAQTHF